MRPRSMRSTRRPGVALEQVASTLDETELLVDVGTAINNGGANPRPVGKFTGLVVDLGDKLTSGSKD